MAPEAPDRRRRRITLGVGALLYLALSLFMFSRVLRLSPTRALTCPCGDPSLFTNFFAWFAAAISRGMNPFYTTAVSFPHGTNLLSNTGAAGIGIPLVPVTWLFGPVLSVNLALILTPVFAGVAMAWVAQRWTHRQWATLLVGGIYGFSPLVLTNLSEGHLNLAVLWVPPLVLACLDELFWRRHHPPLFVGGCLSALIIIQFFVSTEMLLIIAIATLASLIVLGLIGFITDRPGTIVAVRAGAPGALLAGGISIVVLIGPALFALAGPAHYSGRIWGKLGEPSLSLRSFVLPTRSPSPWWDPTRPGFPRPGFMGPALIGTVVVAPIVVRRDRRLAAAAILTAVIGLLALGTSYSLSPWNLVHHLPVIENIFNERFGGLLLLPAGLVLVRVLDAIGTRDRRWSSLLRGLLAAGCALPFLLTALPSLPYPAHRVAMPDWYRTQGAHLAPGEVLFPLNNSGEDALAIQGIQRMRWSTIISGTPEQDIRIPILTSISRNLPNAARSPAIAALVADDIRRSGTTLVVARRTPPDITHPGTRRPEDVIADLTAALGPPAIQDGAAVWRIRPPHR